MATNNEELNAKIRVRGRYPMNSPMMPGQKSSGIKAPRVVRVDVMTGDGPQRGVMEVDQAGIPGDPPNIDLVTDYPSDHFFAMLHSALRP